MEFAPSTICRADEPRMTAWRGAYVLDNAIAKHGIELPRLETHNSACVTLDVTNSVVRRGFFLRDAWKVEDGDIER